MPSLPPIETHDGRRSWAFLALAGGAMVFTVFAAIGVYLVRHSAGLSFWLAVLAHGQVFVVLTAMSFLLGRRASFKISRDSVEIDDSPQTVTEVKP